MPVQLTADINCPSCLVPGTEIEVQRTGKQKSKYDKATVLVVTGTLTDEYGLTVQSAVRELELDRPRQA